EVSARPTKTCHESQPNRVAAHGEKDRNFRCGGLSCQCRRRTARGRDDSDSPPDKIGCKFRQTTDIIFSPTVFEGHVLTFDIAGLLESLTKFAQDLGVAVKRCRVEHTDHGHLLLRPCRERPRRRRAAEQRDELAALHVWMAPAWQEKIERAAQKSLAVMCPACSRSPHGLLALMGSANRGLITRAGSMSR